MSDIVKKSNEFGIKTNKELIQIFSAGFNNNKRKLVKGIILEIKNRIEFMELNQKFTLKVILGDVWKLMSNEVKRSIGKNFAKLVSDNMIIGVSVYKRENNKTIYIKESH